MINVPPLRMRMKGLVRDIRRTPGVQFIRDKMEEIDDKVSDIHEEVIEDKFMSLHIVSQIWTFSTIFLVRFLGSKRLRENEMKKVELELKF